jgi:UDP-N-acetylmuramoyl-tripeptide--D-alanyl-D-alanine ligase
MLRNLIYILQLSLYDIRKFLNFSYGHLSWCKLEKRGKIVWTKKARLVYILTIVIIFLVLAFFFLWFGIFGLICIIPVIAVVPFLIVLSLTILNPVDKFLKDRLIKKAKDFLERNNQNLTIIGITGSYGKTSTREILATILSEKFKIVKPEENINTNLGIADFILKNPEKIRNSNIFIVEMGAYKIGDVKNICNLVNPDHSILTGINESHLERFGSLENIIKTKFELPESTKKLTVLNFDDENIRNNYEKFKIKEIVKISKNSAKDIKILDNFQGIEFRVEGIIFQTKLLALHNISLFLLSMEIARKLGMSLEHIAKGIEKINPITHRLEPIYNKNTNVWIIDDSYNGNSNGIIGGIDVLSRAKGRKIVLTPGLVELGGKSKEIHYKIGRLYADKKIDLVMLIKNNNTKYIINGMESLKFKNYKTYSSTEEAHRSLSQIIKSGDTIIFQNDLPDNYF